MSDAGTPYKLDAAMYDDLANRGQSVKSSIIPVYSPNEAVKKDTALPQPLSARSKGKKKKRPAESINTALNAQSRRVLAQHYRAKYGVK
jgi:hypothetical protein